MTAGRVALVESPDADSHHFRRRLRRTTLTAVVTLDFGNPCIILHVDSQQCSPVCIVFVYVPNHWQVLMILHRLRDQSLGSAACTRLASGSERCCIGIARWDCPDAGHTDLTDTPSRRNRFHSSAVCNGRSRRFCKSEILLQSAMTNAVRLVRSHAKDG